jgi:D-cysteine desulfhydrase family pyridoxal phosphate-dependent enzyme
MKASAALRPYVVPKWAQEVGLRVVPSKFVPLTASAGPTRLHRWHLPSVDESVEVWIKRDDETGLVTSGNKIRKLQFLLADAVQQERDCVVTIGGWQSNHCRATAAAARELGIECHLILRTDYTPDNIPITGNVALDMMMNAQLHLVSVAEYKRVGSAQLLSDLGKRLEQEGKKPYLIPVGGSNEIGAWGYMQATEELRQQMQDNNVEFDDIVMTIGSGGTTGGLALGMALSGQSSRTKLHAFCACDSNEYFYNELDQLIANMGLGDKFKARDLVSVNDKYIGLGYSISRKEELELIIEVAQHTGVVVDPTYTGKALFGLINEIKQDAEKWKGRKVLFLHTGGIYDIYSRLEQLSPLFAKAQMNSWPTSQ